MPKIYDQKQDPERVGSEPERETRERKPGFEPERVQNRTMVLVIAAILAVVIVVLFYRMVRSEEIAAAAFTVPAIVSMITRQ